MTTLLVGVSDRSNLKLRNGGIRARLRLLKADSKAIPSLEFMRDGHTLGLRLRPPSAAGQPAMMVITLFDQASKTNLDLVSRPIEDKVRRDLGGNVLEFITIERTLIGRINGKTLLTAQLPPEFEIGPTNLTIFGANHCEARDLELMVLDGLSEAEALKVAGIAVDSESPRWESAFSDLSQFPGLEEQMDGWIRSSDLKEVLRTDDGGERKIRNGAIRARMRFTEKAGLDATHLLLRRGSGGGDHFELRYYRNLRNDWPNQFQIRHWDNTKKKSNLLASTEVFEDVHDAPEGFLLEFFVIGDRFHGKLNGAHAITAEVPDASSVNPGGVGFAMLEYCWLKDMEFLDLDGVDEAEALGYVGLENPSPPARSWTRVWSDPHGMPNLGSVSEGWAVTKEGVPGALLTSAPITHGGVRARFRGAATGQPPQLMLRDPGNHTGYNLMPAYGGLNFRRNDPDAPGRNVTLKKFDTPLPAPGEAYELEFIAVGRTLMARLNGQTFEYTLDEAEPEPKPGNMRLYQVDSNAFQDVEILNLDGLPEAEALRLAGFANAPAQPKAGPVPVGGPSWSKVWQDLEDIPNVGDVIEGWAVTNDESSSVALSGTPIFNGGLRARFRAMEKKPPPQLILRQQGSQRGYNLMPAYDALFIRRVDPEAPNRNVTLQKFQIPLPAAGEEYSLEFLAIGRTLMARLNEQTFEYTLDEAEPALLPGILRIYQVDVNPFRDAEIINLDSLSETEALKFARSGGAREVAETVPSKSVPAPQ